MGGNFRHSFEFCGQLILYDDEDEENLVANPKYPRIPTFGSAGNNGGKRSLIGH